MGIEVRAEHRRLLRKLLAGDCPYCSARQFKELQNLPEMPPVLQREALHGADAHGVWALTWLRDGPAQQQDEDALRAWLEKERRT